MSERDFRPQCTYHENNRLCRDIAEGELDAHYEGNGGKPWPMCGRHVEKRFHPPDLHKRLRRWDTIPGRIRRALT